MKLSGLSLFKLLPGGKKEEKSNCKACGFPTCMAFAMKLAKAEVDLKECPHASDELKALLSEHSGKKLQEISFGLRSNPIIIGAETVLYRHDKTFVNPTCISIRIKTSQDLNYIYDLADKVCSYKVDRVGQEIGLDSLTIEDDNGNTDQFIKIIKDLIDKGIADKLSFILVSENYDALIDTVKLLSDKQKPLLYLKKTTELNYKNLFDNCKVPICIEAENIESLISLSENLAKYNISDIVLTLPSEMRKNPIESLTLLRRSVVIDNFKPLSFPVLTFTSDYSDNSDPVYEGLWAGNLICKYSNILIMDNFDPAVMLALFTLRLNLYTDPQKPLQIEPKLYTIGDVDENSPVIVTTNFALTYFTVAGEIEASNVPSYLLITPSEGMSVLTAWAANKFNGEVIAKAVKDAGIENSVKHKNIIISGYVEVLKAEIEEELPGWNVLVAPKEAVDLPEYLHAL